MRREPGAWAVAVRLVLARKLSAARGKRTRWVTPASERSSTRDPASRGRDRSRLLRVVDAVLGRLVFRARQESVVLRVVDRLLELRLTVGVERVTGRTTLLLDLDLLELLRVGV